ncbi:MAG: succinate--CoA ligase subunit alpha [Candidatus Omnitrophica bacterium]|nr:succinate--CoA ligase subunit alpha [Candidatus Omnitrophota bacterium]
MSILINENTKVLVQGITGRDGSFHAASMLDYGTKVVGGVTPGKGGQKVGDLPVFNSVKDALSEKEINCSIIYVPARFASAAIKEAADNKIPLIVCITEGVPINEMLYNYYYVKDKGVRLIGPNCPGLISPGKSKAGIMPAKIHLPGNIGVISRSGTLTYEFVYNLTINKMGQSTCVGIGGDAVVGTGYIELLEMFEKDPDTNAIVLIGEIGGEEEEKAAEYIKANVKKPVVSFISGRSAPADKKMGHAGAIISQGRGTASAKIEALNKAGIPVADCPSQIPKLITEKSGVS